MNFNILVGTMTGTAELVAEEIDIFLNDSGHKSYITLIDNFNHDELENIKNLVICSSTYGQGDVPDGSQSFYDFLSNTKINLAHLRYGVFALGDMTYAETFCFGGKRFDEALSQLNAQKVIDTFCHNASDGSLPEEHAPDWAKDFLKNISEIK